MSGAYLEGGGGNYVVRTSVARMGMQVTTTKLQMTTILANDNRSY